MNEWRSQMEGFRAPAMGFIPGVVVGKVNGTTAAGQPLVTWEGAEQGTPALVAWFANAPAWSVCEGLRVVLAFEDGEATRPILLGLLDAPPAKVSKAETLRVESEKELVIECGKAKIALRADGRIEIRGGHLISRSTGPNKIKGGTVHIN